MYLDSKTDEIAKSAHSNGTRESEYDRATKWFVPRPCFSRSLLVDEFCVPPVTNAQEAANVAAHACKLSDATEHHFAHWIEEDRKLQVELLLISLELNILDFCMELFS